MEHYFTDNRHLDTNRKEISFRFWCFNYRFLSDNGVFSKGGIDYGTQVFLESLKNEAIHGKVLDLGCGYGVIGIILKHQFENIQVDMVDVNPRALLLAKENAQLNKCDVNIYESHSFDNISDRYRYIITNPPIRAGKKIIYDMFEKAYDHLEEGGQLWIVIQKKQGAPSAMNKLNEIFGNCETICHKRGYFIIRSIKN